MESTHHIKSYDINRILQKSLYAFTKDKLVNQKKKKEPLRVEQRLRISKDNEIKFKNMTTLLIRSMSSVYEYAFTKE